MSLLPQGPSSIVKIFLLSFRLFRASFLKTIGFGFIIALISVEIANYINSLVFTLYEKGDISHSEQMFIDIVHSSEFYWSFPLFIMMIVGFIFSGAIIYQIDQSAQQKQSSYKKSFLFGLKKLPSLLLAAILKYIFIALVVTIAAIASILIILLMKSVGFNPFSGDYNKAIFILWTILSYILVTSLFFLLFFFVYYIVLDKQSAFSSLKSSYALVRNAWWRTLTVYIISIALVTVTYLGLYQLLDMLFFLIHDLVFDGNEASIHFIQMLFIPISALLNSIFIPFLYTVWYLQFRDLKLRKAVLS